MSDLLLKVIVYAQTLDPEDQDKIAATILREAQLPVIEA